MARDYRKIKTPMQALRAVVALGVDHEGDLIVPGRAEGCDELNLVKAIRRVISENKGVE